MQWEIWSPYRFIVVNTGGKNIIGNDDSKDSLLTLYYQLAILITLENVRNYDQSFP